MAKTVLTQRQKLLLTLLSQEKGVVDHFYLSGGTALAEYYLHHRYSEDLDFFSFEEIDPMAVQVIFKKLQKKASYKSIDFQQSFNRNLFFIHFDNEVIKTEFTYYPFVQLEKQKIEDGLKIDSLMDIAVNKVFTIYQNPRSRDFIDLYLIIKSKNFVFRDLRQKARMKFDTHIDPLQMAQKLLLAQEVRDFPRMVMPLAPQEWIQFWMDEAGKLKKEVLV
ncbi:nucleotidyl transferase AbiEii/AbiGii toxin family protein [Patescibacteria group bacterium]|nr:nucleotidyl transferase AbiEii/AbiGii toxin family protein [Patescibacteria group bacterium]MBU4016892.1 nucleotidyl transferase AbiEii/AbiGii toxin family protein [Patescibacteria group bacterium]MBU4098339.1 nucleotidyl transferase AbiEii/AbiGii toxin family protein [Patescibacteria group bacterium]